MQKGVYTTIALMFEYIRAHYTRFWPRYAAKHFFWIIISFASPCRICLGKISREREKEQRKKSNTQRDSNSQLFLKGHAYCRCWLIENLRKILSRNEWMAYWPVGIWGYGDNPTSGKVATDREVAGSFSAYTQEPATLICSVLGHQELNEGKWALTVL